MQFACESCKTQLQIADEKVRGKRLIVRCKRCGAKIGISDPALKAKPKPAAAAVARAPSVAGPQPAHPASDTESTRAMDSDMLEKALEASKTDDPSKMNGAPARSAAAPPASDAPEWFAMLHGKQTGPMTRVELTAKTNDGAVGPRTYLWKDGMESWQRAKDLPELSGLFPQLPEPAAPPPSMPPPVNQGLREFSTPDFGTPIASEPKPLVEPPIAKNDEPLQLATEPAANDKNAADLAQWASEELSKKSNPAVPRAPPPSSAPRMFEGAAPPQSRSPIGIVVVLAVLAAAAIVLWFTLGGAGAEPGPAASGKKDQAAAPASPVTTVPARPEQPPAPPLAEAKAPEKPPEKQTGLTADQVRKKLDENKAALQGCIDEALRRDPNLRVGKIHIATTIAPNGQVTSARIDKPSVEQSRLGACLRGTTRKIAFPSFLGDAFDVDIPIVVTAGD
ncbi:MAG: GYF domain-containing protein [Myxococcales bacterium]